MKISQLLRAFLICGLFASARAAEGPAATPAADGMGVQIPFKIIRSVPINYPIVLLKEGVANGEARVLINISPEGKLVDTLVLAYTHLPFANAALTAIRQWRYEPAKLNGEPVGTVADCSFEFNVDGILLVQRTGVPVYQKRDPFGDRFAYKPQTLSGLDAIPAPVRVVRPVYPQEWEEQGMRGQVTIDFYIDEEGTVRMPSVASAVHPMLAATATAAVREWRFSPPLKQGRPVLTHCQQVFTFERDTGKP
ncbi:MAG TPA: energy transducer TonB [Opitutaceae bacterium]|nr:energy transducer TonB [Opitutaceae bacterium]